MSYAGRLDPMARGLLVVLQGLTTFEQNELHLLSKEYQFEVK